MTPRRDLGRLGIVGVVVFSVSSIRRSAVFNVEHLRHRLRAGQREGERRGKDWAWCVRATRELRGVKARPERARRRRPFNGGAATAPLNLCTPRQTEELSLF